jgi:hypothetical protein
MVLTANCKLSCWLVKIQFLWFVVVVAVVGSFKCFSVVIKWLWAGLGFLLIFLFWIWNEPWESSLVLVADLLVLIAL